MVRTLALLSLTAVAYYVAGRLGLLLAIPPGYATAVWPPSGIALGAVLLWGKRVWPGILLGSFLVNVGTALDDGSMETIARSMAIALPIGIGAALQAVAGGWLVRKLVGSTSIFTLGSDVLRLLLYGGPLSCLINASVGVTTLWLAGLIPGPNVLFNWFTWWVGDSIGVLIFTTLMLVWANPGRAWRRQQISVTLPMLCMFAGVVALFFFVSEREDLRIRAEFEDWAQRFEHALEKQFDVYDSMLAAMAGFYSSSEAVTPAEFESFSRRLLVGNPEVQALSWNPRVTTAGLRAFEAAQRAWRKDYRVYELVGDQRHPVRGRADHFPIQYIAPLARNGRAPGYDIGSEAVRRNAIERAIRERRNTATGPISLVQTPGRVGILILGPVYASDGAVQGMVALTIDVANVIAPSQALIASTGMRVRIHDSTASGPPLFLHAYGQDVTSGGFERSSEMGVGGRRWRLDFSVPEATIVARRSWMAWAMLAAGLLFTALIGIFLLVVVGQAARTEVVVLERTASLNAANAELQAEVAERARLQREADLRSQQLADKNRELERFAYVVSHDLQAPLRSLSGFAGLLRDRFATQLGDEGREFLDFITQGAAQMHRMIRDILALSRVGTHEINLDSVDMGAVIERARGSLRADIDAARARVIVGPMPVISADAAQMQQLFQNLIGNAIKFRVAGRDPEVSVTAEQGRESWHFEVTDNGIGIPADKVERLFNLFSRLHREDEYPGSGIGLAICKRIVERHRGQIWVTSEPDRGSTFHVVVPAA